MTRVGLIGAKSFIGSHLVQSIEKLHSAELVKFARTADTPDLIPIDLNDKNDISEKINHFDLIYYLASDSIPASTWSDPIREIESNLLPFINFMGVASRKAGKIAFISSGGTVYGPTRSKVDENSPTKPFSPYGIIKLTMENFLEYYRIKYGINYDVYRISNVYGPGQNTKKGLGVINTFIESIINTGKVNVFGQGETTRNYIYVKDVAELLMLSLNSLKSSEVYNLSSNDTLSINSLLSLMKEIVPLRFEIDYNEARKSDNSFIDLDNSKIRERCQTFTFTPLTSGIKETFSFIKQSSI